VSTPDPATTDWEPAWQLSPPQAGMPTPVVNGQWLKGVYPSVVWAPLQVPGTVAPDLGWHNVGAAGEPAYQDGWETYPGWQGARFRKTADGMVYIQGLVRRPSGNPANWSVIFTLPIGYRMGAFVNYECVSVGGVPQVLGTDSSGNLYWHTGTPANAAAYLFLGGISYLAEA